VQIYMESIDPAKNRRRWYRVTIQGFLVIREWGRIGQVGRRTIETAGNPEARAAQLVTQKKRRGYGSPTARHQTRPLGY